MGKIQRIAQCERLNQLDSDAKFWGETNDCSVKVLAILADVSYEVAHAALRTAGRKTGQGFWDDKIRNTFRQMTGQRLYIANPKDIIDRYPGQHCNLKSMTTYHPIRFKKVFANLKGKYMVFTADHVCAMVDGEIIDWSHDRALRVVSLWKVE